MVDAQLRILFGKAGEPGLLDIGLAVAVGVFEVHDLAGDRGQHASLPGLNAGGEQQMIGEHVHGLEASVAVAIFQQLDLRLGKLARLGGLG